MQYYKQGIIPSSLEKLNPYVAAYLAEMGTQPSSGQKSAINNFIVGIIDDGLWSKFDTLYLLGIHADQPSRVNLVNPGTDTLTVTGSPTFTPGSGSIGGWVGASGGYLETTTLSTAFAKYTQNNAHFGFYCETSYNLNGSAMGTILNANEIRPYASGYQYTMINASYAFGTAGRVVADSIGHSVANRTSSTTYKAYRDGVKLGANSSVTSTALAAVTLKICGGIFGVPTGRFSLAHSGSKFTDGEVTDLYDRYETFRTEWAAA